MNRMLQRWLLINYPGRPSSPTCLLPDNGLAGLSAVLLKLGCYVRILDYSHLGTLQDLSNAKESIALKKIWESKSKMGKVKKIIASLKLFYFELAAQIREFYFRRKILLDITTHIADNKIDALGFKLWAGEGFASIFSIVGLLKKKFPEVLIVGGGPQVDIFMTAIFHKKVGFDVLVYGEGEESLELLAKSDGIKESFFKIPNLLFEFQNAIHKTSPKKIKSLDAIPIPNYAPEIYPNLQTNKKIKIFVIEESRGCPNKCAFCIHPIKSHTPRVKSIDRILEEIERINKNFGVSTFRFAGSCTPYSLLMEFAQAVLKKKLNIAYSSFAALHNLANVDFALLAQSGCKALFFGLESGSQFILSRMNKKNDLNIVPDILDKIKNSGIFTIASLIYPAPGETDATQKETEEFLSRAKFDALIVQAPIVIPGTEWFTNSINYGIHLGKDYMVRAMNWQVQYLLPLSLWKPLPVRINGKSYKKVLFEAASFSQKLKDQGCLIGVSDDIYLMSIRMGIPIHDFVSEAQKAYFSKFVPDISRMIQSINRGL
jgi:radical SAM superfamily enzyme YgiQ (UPF0313 family)